MSKPFERGIIVFVQIFLASVDYAVDILDSVVGNISKGNISALLQEAEEILKEIQKRRFGPFENDAMKELEKANNSMEHFWIALHFPIEPLKFFLDTFYLSIFFMGL